MVLARGRGRSYALWAIFCSASTATFFAWHLWLCRKHGRPLTGSSPAAFSAGVIAAFIMLFETSLSLRKRWRRVAPRFLGQVRWWLHAHLWLGLSTLPLVLIHTGGFVGGPYNVLLLGAFGVVWVSGVVGWALQQWLPRKLITDSPHETVANAIPMVIESLLERAKGALPFGEVDSERVWNPKPFAIAAGVKISAEHHERLNPSRRTLADFHERILAPFLKFGGRGSPLSDSLNAEIVLNRLIDSPDDASIAAVTSWRRLCDERRDLDRQRRLHSWLHRWVAVHVVATVALLILLGGHVILALRHVAWQGW